jgi:hypothetical protein
MKKPMPMKQMTAKKTSTKMMATAKKGGKSAGKKAC